MSAYAVAFADTVAAARRQVTYLDGLRVEPRLQRDLGEAMAPFDAPICATTAVPGLPAGDDLLGRLVVNGQDHGEPLWAAMTVPLDINNRCPVLNVPSGRSSWGLPTGPPDRRPHVRRPDRLPHRQGRGAPPPLDLHPGPPAGVQ
ncbi:hypothetical protein AB0A76_25970 [Streptomyces exfoliatus]|uniref:Amidase domain-containing protein n=1 Tax=Streptomyces exfoliatus TaxID=1905 RepID=A0ABV3D4G1_STREX